VKLAILVSEESTMIVRQWSVLAVIGLLSLGGLRAPAADDGPEARMRRDITFLASDECEGRGVTTKGINLAADYIAGAFQKTGLKPGGADGSYFQPFTMTGGAKLGSPNQVVLHGPGGKEIELKLGDDFQPLGLSAAGKVTAPVVFVGYGATAKDIAYDDYKDVDVAGKVVIVLRKTPQPGNTKTPFDGDRNLHHAALATKLVNADEHKAAAVLFVSDRDTAKDKDPLMDFAYTASGGSPTKLPAVHVHRALADNLLQSGLDTGLRDVEDKIDHNLKPHSGPLEGWTASVEVNVKRPAINVKNVVGVSEGSGPLAKETVVIGAHYDHLGYGGAGSLAKNRNERAIHHGADDNASGTTTLVELARRFGGIPNREGRRLVFIAFSGEESGLLGSAHYCKHPLFPLADTVAMLNMDMVGRLRPDKPSWPTILALVAPRPYLVPVLPLAVAVEAGRQNLLPLRDKLIVYGTGSAKTFDKLIDTLNMPYHFKLQKVPTGMGPSDQQSFYAKKVPVFFFFTGDHPDYHRPSDTSDKINVAGMRRVADLVEGLVGRLATEPERPQFVQVAGGSGGSPGVSVPRIGIMPSYGDDKEGVLLGGVVEGGPAAKAGLKEGDRIVEVGGKPVRNLEGYMVLIAAHKRGEPVELGVLRGGKKTAVKVTPQ
jgi:hypothetical protein